MARPALEVADILRDHGPAWREANRGHVSLEQLKVMSAIESCRTAALGGHVARCENAACGYTVIAYNSCRNRLGARLEQEVVDDGLVLVGDDADLRRQREHDVEVGHLQQLGLVLRLCD